VFAQKQPDRPPNNYATGFVFYHGASGLESELEAFIENGDPPLVLALGSTAVMEPGRLIETFVQAAKRVGRRAVIQVGAEQRTSYASRQTKDLFVAWYVPYGSLMPRAGCIVHAGGVGTTAQAMRSGRPMLVVPSSNDQLDHADHVRRLGIAREVHQKCLTVGRAARELERLLRDPSFGRRAESVASQLSREKRCHRRRGRPRTGLRYDGSPRGGLFVTYLHSLVFLANVFQDYVKLGLPFDTPVPSSARPRPAPEA